MQNVDRFAEFVARFRVTDTVETGNPGLPSRAYFRSFPSQYVNLNAASSVKYNKQQHISGMFLANQRICCWVQTRSIECTHLLFLIEWDRSTDYIV